MTDYIKVDIKSFQDICKRLETLESENKDLKLENDFLQRRVDYFTSGKAGRDFARDLLGLPMTEEDIAIKAENASEKHEAEITDALSSYGDDL